MAKKDWLFWVTVTAILGLITWGILALSSQDNNAPQKTQDILNIKNNDWTKGNQQARNIIVEYSDFACPYCQLSNFYMQRLLASPEFSPQLMVVYRHFPIPNHPNSLLAAYASEAAGQQNKFWEMHDLLFAKQAEWSNQAQADAQKTFITYAQGLNLDTQQFTNDLNNQDVKNRVTSDISDGDQGRLNITYTPTIYLNGKIIELQESYDKFEQYFRQQLSAN
ncbi:MAG: thioredoxin domain-containing protein [Patescibacteria group bacterium]